MSIVSTAIPASEFLKRHSLALGIVLMFLFTWPIDLANSGMLPIQFPFVVYLFLGWGFVFASVMVTGLTLGKQGVVSLLKRYLHWRTGWQWYLVAFGLMPALYIVGVYLHAAFTRVSPDFSKIMAYKLFGESANLPLFVLPFFLIDLIANGEEIGWRGFVLPRLQARYNALASTLILGVIWGLWHLPKFLSHFDLVAFGWFMLHTLAFAVILTWLYNSTRGSLLLVAICHAAINTVGIFLPVANTTSGENMGAYMVIVLLELAAAIVIIVIAGPARLSRTEPVQT
ncbi:MAG: CPBP family intramembrane glutamic endopeptidase [Anaerolineales bacterium]